VQWFSTFWLKTLVYCILTYRCWFVESVVGIDSRLVVVDSTSVCEGALPVAVAPVVAGDQVLTVFVNLGCTPEIDETAYCDHS
jgi:hypothetical protein